MLAQCCNIRVLFMSARFLARGCLLEKDHSCLHKRHPCAHGMWLTAPLPLSAL
jgi:hypothetical protein